MKIRELLDAINTIAPFALAESWDNVGLQTGDPEATAGPVLVALEVSDAVLDEAEQRGAKVILSHHPLIFAPLKSLAESTPVTRLVARLIRSDISLIAAHTNWDSTPAGTNGEIAERLKLIGLKPLLPAELPTRAEGDETRYGLGLLGHLASPCDLDQFAATCKASFGLSSVGLVGKPFARIHRVAICTGSGGSLLEQAAAGGADVLVTGEMNHHAAWEARARGLAVVLLGHFESEAVASARFAERLAVEMRARGESIEIMVAESETPPVRRV